MHRAYSTSIIYERNDQVETKQLVLGAITAQRLIIAPDNKISNTEVIVAHRRERSLLHWTRAGAALGAIWGLIFDTVVLPIPRLSTDLFAGPLASWVSVVIQDAIVFGFISGLCMGLIRMLKSKRTPIK